VGFTTWVAMVFFAGSSDRVFVELGISYQAQVLGYEIAIFIVPFIAFWIAKRVCEELQRSEAHPLRAWTGGRVRRTSSGGFEETREEP
jgi:hypothetical protein